MSFSNQTDKALYQGDGGNTTFAIPFTVVVDDSAEVEVWERNEIDTDDIVETLQVEGALQDYTLTGAPTPSDFHVNVEFNTAPAATSKILIRRKLAITQTLDQGASSFDPRNQEVTFDRVVAMIQQLNEKVNRTPRLPVTSPLVEADTLLTDPDPAQPSVIGYDDSTEAYRFFTLGELAALATGITDTDDVPEGASNLYYTNSRADARISAAVINALSDVTITAPANGEVLKYNGSSWVNGPSSGGGGGAFNWVERANAPIKTFLGVYTVYEFEALLAQELYMTVRVPTSYIAGNPISLKIEAICNDTSEAFLFRAQSTLVRAEVDDYDSTTNQRTTTNTAITMSASNDKEPQKITLDITSSIGEINAVAVTAGDIIGVRFFRDVDTGTDTATGSLYLLVGGEELSLS